MLNSYQSNFARYPLHLVGDYNIGILNHLESASAQNFTNLQSASWENLGIDSNDEVLYNSFYDIIHDLYDECFPLCHRRAKVIDARKPYINEYIRGLIKESK